MERWETLARARAPDGAELVLVRRGQEYVIRAGGWDLMSSADEGSSRALAELGCAHLDGQGPARVLVGGLGCGYTLRAALDAVGQRGVVVVAELVPEVVTWNRAHLSALAGYPLDDPRTVLEVRDVAQCIRGVRSEYDAILLDVDNGPDHLAHEANAGLYGSRGLADAFGALRPGGVLGVWSFSDDPEFTARLARAGLAVRLHRVPGSRKGRGRWHFVWVAVKRTPGSVHRAC